MSTWPLWEAKAEAYMIVTILCNQDGPGLVKIDWLEIYSQSLHNNWLMPAIIILICACDW